MIHQYKLDQTIICPECNEALDYSTRAYGDEHVVPQDGDGGMCACCLTFIVYEGSNGRHATHARVMTPDEIAGLSAEARGMLVRLRATLKRMGWKGKRHAKPDDNDIN